MKAALCSAAAALWKMNRSCAGMQSRRRCRAMNECIWKGKDGVCVLHSQTGTCGQEEVISFCVEGPCPDEEWEED